MFSFIEGFSHSNLIKKIILISLLIGTVISFLVTMVAVYKYGGVDLRNRTVGARLIWKGINPYIIPAEPPPDEYFLDATQRYPGRSRTTVTPLFLLLYTPIAWIHYSIQRLVWAIIEWIAIILSLILLLKIIKSKQDRYYLLIFFLLFFCCGAFWKFHLERGQYYIILTLLLSVAIYFEQKRQGSIYGGIAFGFLAMLRPTFFLFIPFLFLFKKYKTMISMVITSLILFEITLFFGGFQMWISYFENIKLIENQVINESLILDKYGHINNEVPKMAEGVDLLKIMDIRIINETFLGLLSKLSSKYIHKDLPKSFITINNGLVITIIVISIIIIIKVRCILHDNAIMMLYPLNIILLIDYFSPERFPYSDVLFMPVIALIVVLKRYKDLSPSIAIAMITAFSIDYFIMWDNGYIGSLLRVLLFTVTVNLIIFSLIVDIWREKKGFNQV